MKKIGLLGGSFNPAHDGHLYISQKAIELLGLDEVWWLVSPQNPLKSTEQMAPFAQRYEGAKDILKKYDNIIASDFEMVNQTNKTYDSLSALISKFSENNFIWLMGADNLVQFPQWYKYDAIMHMLPIAIFDRGDYAKNLNNTEFYKKYEKYLVDNSVIFTKDLPAWMFLKIDKHPASSTDIRARLR
ncbi:nicotinate (nicotinamide) nucleotide adenylyltransferase [Rickettsiales bacterium]|nr:nicotinate (nicotinamide) nucleotide adenylyltransferase [Rickettsiales bacterium]